MNPSVRNSLFAVVAVAAVGAGFYFFKSEKPKAQEPVEASAKAAPTPVAAPKDPSAASARYPVPVANKRALPESLDESDSFFEGELSELIGQSAFSSLLVSEDLIRRFVMMVDNATDAAFNLDLIPYKELPSSFAVQRKGDHYWVDNAKNEARYQPYMAVVNAIDIKKVADLYFHFYPLLQVAYRELKPEGYFNDRVVEVIDHLSQTPEITEPIELQKFMKSYKYTDPKLEALSTSQKVLLRMGAENTKKVKAKLKVFREIVILGQ